MSVFVSSTWTTAQPSTTTKLIEKVARIYGLQDDSDAQALAKDFLDDTIKEMNSHTYEFNLVRQTGIAMTADDPEVSISSNFFKEKITHLVETATGRAADPLVYIDWATFQRLYGNPSVRSSDPLSYSSFNVQEEGKLYLAPKPSASTASDYTLTTEYYRRIPLVSETAQLTVPQEIENVLLYGAWKRMAMHVQGGSHPDVGGYEMQELKALERLQTIDRKHPDEATRFRMYDRRIGGRGQRLASPVYVKLD